MKHLWGHEVIQRQILWNLYGFFTTQPRTWSWNFVSGIRWPLQRHHRGHFITGWVTFWPFQIVIAAQLVREVDVLLPDLEIFAKGTLVAFIRLYFKFKLIWGGRLEGISYILNCERVWSPLFDLQKIQGLRYSTPWWPDKQAHLLCSTSCHSLQFSLNSSEFK